MSEERNLNKVSIEDLGKEKLQAEINILKARLEKEFPDEKPDSRFSKLAEFARKWSGFLLGSLTLISAIIGVFLPLSQYLIEQRKALDYKLNGEMIGMVDSLSNPDPKIANKSVMMLSYYETNSIPIMLFYLEINEGKKMQAQKNALIRTISTIYAKKQDKMIIEKVLGGIQNTFNQLKSSGDSEKKQAMYNYFDLVEEMPLSSPHENMLDDLFLDIKDTLCSNPEKTNEFGLRSIQRRICKFVDEDPCNCAEPKVNALAGSINKTFEKVKVTISAGKEITKEQKKSMFNDIAKLNTIKLTKNDSSIVIKLYQRIVDDICSDKSLRQKLKELRENLCSFTPDEPCHCNDQIVRELANSINSTFKQIKIEDGETISIDQKKNSELAAYLDIVNSMQLNDDNHRQLEDLLKGMKEKICNDSILKVQMNSIILEVCEFIDEDPCGCELNNIELDN